MRPFVAPVAMPPIAMPSIRATVRDALATPKARRVIQLFMNGGVSHLESFDPKPMLNKYAGKTIAEIFADHGEPYFREGERRVIARLLGQGAQVLATGGGAFINNETRARIQEEGVSVWLRAPLDLLMKRVMRRQDRPLLKTDDPGATLRKCTACCGNGISMPSFANSSAAASASCTSQATATTVTSLPLRLISALPSGIV